MTVQNHTQITQGTPPADDAVPVCQTEYDLVGFRRQESIPAGQVSKMIFEAHPSGRSWFLHLNPWPGWSEGSGSRTPKNMQIRMVNWAVRVSFDFQSSAVLRWLVFVTCQGSPSVLIQDLKLLG